MSPAGKHIQLFDRRALVVDSHGDFRKTLHSILDLHGWFVMSTPRALDAMTLVGGLAPQLVLLDMELLDLDPIGLVSTVRHANLKRPMAIYGMATRPMLDLEVRALRRAGLDGVLMKPFDLDLDQLDMLTEHYN